MLGTVNVRKLVALVCLAALLLAFSSVSSGLQPAVLCPYWVFLALVVLAVLKRKSRGPELYSFRSGGSRVAPVRSVLPTR